MEMLGWLHRLLEAMPHAGELEGKGFIWEEDRKIEPLRRAMIGTKWADAGSPVVLWIAPDQTRPEKAEAIAWGLAHVALGHLVCDDDATLSVASFTKGYRPPPRLSGSRLLEEARKDVCLKAFIWAAYLLVEGWQEGLPGPETSAKAMALRNGRESLPRDLVGVWTRCIKAPAKDVEEVIGRPRDWAAAVLDLAATAGGSDV